MTTYQISELASRTGTTPATLRYYEQEGLLRPNRSPAGYRLYGEEAVGHLDFIGAAKRLGLPLAEIRVLLAAWRDGECTDVRDQLRPLLEARIASARQHATELSAATTRLSAALARLDGPASAGRCDPGCCVPLDEAPVEVVDACTLSAGSQVVRVREWRELLAQAQRRDPVDGGMRLSLPLAAAAQAAELAAAEVQCCPFFAFALHISQDGALLDIRAPRERLSQLSAILDPHGFRYQ